MGDSLRFTSKLAEESQRIGVTFKFNTKVTSLELQQNGDGDGDGKRISALVTDNEVIEVPDQAQVVVAAGSWTPRLLWYADLFVPVYPMKGYSVIIDLPPKGISITSITIVCAFSIAVPKTHLSQRCSAIPITIYHPHAHPITIAITITITIFVTFIDRRSISSTCRRPPKPNRERQHHVHGTVG